MSSNIFSIIAIKAFDNYDVLNKNVLIYKKNRDLLINSFEDMGFSNMHHLMVHFIYI